MRFKKNIATIGVVGTTAFAILVVGIVVGALPRTMLIPSLLSFAVLLVASAFIFFAAYVDEHHFHGTFEERLSPFRLALGFASALALVGLIEVAL